MRRAEEQVDFPRMFRQGHLRHKHLPKSCKCTWKAASCWKLVKLGLLVMDVHHVGWMVCSGTGVGQLQSTKHKGWEGEGRNHKGLKH